MRGHGGAVSHIPNSKLHQRCVVHVCVWCDDAVHKLRLPRLVVCVCISVMPIPYIPSPCHKVFRGVLYPCRMKVETVGPMGTGVCIHPNLEAESSPSDRSLNTPSSYTVTVTTGVNFDGVSFDTREWHAYCCYVCYNAHGVIIKLTPRLDERQAIENLLHATCVVYLCKSRCQLLAVWLYLSQG